MSESVLPMFSSRSFFFLNGACILCGLCLGCEAKTIPNCSNMLKNHLRGREKDAELSHHRKQHYSSSIHLSLLLLKV